MNEAPYTGVRKATRYRGATKGSTSKPAARRALSAAARHGRWVPPWRYQGLHR